MIKLFRHLEPRQLYAQKSVRLRSFVAQIQARLVFDDELRFDLSGLLKMT